MAVTEEWGCGQMKRGYPPTLTAQNACGANCAFGNADFFAATAVFAAGAEVFCCESSESEGFKPRACAECAYIRHMKEGEEKREKNVRFGLILVSNKSTNTS